MKKIQTIILFSTLFFASCMTPQKATDFLKDKEVLDDVCAKEFPCVTKDSVITITKSDSADYQASIDALLTMLEIAYTSQDSLISEITLKDSNCIKYAGAIRQLQNENIRLQERVKNVKPVTVYRNIIVRVLDSAAQQVLHDQVKQLTHANNNLTDRIAAKDKEVAELKEKAKAWKVKALITWFIILMAVVGGGLLKRFGIL